MAKKIKNPERFIKRLRGEIMQLKSCVPFQKLLKATKELDDSWDGMSYEEIQKKYDFTDEEIKNLEKLAGVKKPPHRKGGKGEKR